MDWQPIETAPKDGTTVLLFAPDAAEPRVMLGDWLTETCFEVPGEEPGGWVDPWVTSGWPIDATPTHWAPIPDISALDQ